MQPILKTVRNVVDADEDGPMVLERSDDENDGSDSDDVVLVEQGQN